MIDGRFQLEFIIFEIDDGEKRQCLLLIILDKDLLGHSVLGWKRASDGPYIFFNVIGVANPLLITTTEK